MSGLPWPPEISAGMMRRTIGATAPRRVVRPVHAGALWLSAAWPGASLRSWTRRCTTRRPAMSSWRITRRFCALPICRMRGSIWPGAMARRRRPIVWPAALFLVPVSSISMPARSRWRAAIHRKRCSVMRRGRRKSRRHFPHDIGLRTVGRCSVGRTRSRAQRDRQCPAPPGAHRRSACTTPKLGSTSMQPPMVRLPRSI